MELLETLVNTTLSLVICKSDYGAANEVVEGRVWEGGLLSQCKKIVEIWVVRTSGKHWPLTLKTFVKRYCPPNKAVQGRVCEYFLPFSSLPSLSLVFPFLFFTPSLPRLFFIPFCFFFPFRFRFPLLPFPFSSPPLQPFLLPLSSFIWLRYVKGYTLYIVLYVHENLITKGEKQHFYQILQKLNSTMITII